MENQILNDKAIYFENKKRKLNLEYFDIFRVIDKWEKSEVLDQHDIQEAMRIVFDFLEQGLSGSVALNEFHRLLK